MFDLSQIVKDWKESAALHAHINLYKNYLQVWNQRLAARIGRDRVRDVRPVHIENVLVSILRENPALSKRTVQRD